MSPAIRILILCSSLLPVIGMAAPMQKIFITDTNNHPLADAVWNMVLPDSLGDPLYTELRRMLPASLLDSKTGEWERMQHAVAWVHQQWQHDSQGTDPSANSVQILQRAKRGERFSCTEYGKVLRDVLQSIGIVARTIGIQTPNIAYGPPGSAHVAVEAWSNEQQKWMLLDAQWGVIPIHNKQPINVIEFYQLQQLQKLGELNLLGPGRGEQRDYLEFMQGFNGYLSTRLRDRNVLANLIMPITGRELPLTFQGLPKNTRIFTRNPADVYFPLNRTAIYLGFTHSKANNAAFAHMQYQTDEQYLQLMSTFTPVAEFTVELSHNMPWFDHFEYQTGKGAWKPVMGSSLAWSAKGASPELKARAVNGAGIAGPATSIKLRIEK